jgi:hypothetical protein
MGFSGCAVQLLQQLFQIHGMHPRTHEQWLSRKTRTGETPFAEMLFDHFPGLWARLCCFGHSHIFSEFISHLAMLHQLVVIGSLKDIKTPLTRSQK